MNEESILIEKANSIYEQNVLDAINNEKATKNVIIAAINNNCISIYKDTIVAFLNNKFIQNDKELYELLFNKIKRTNNTRIFNELVKSKFFSKENFDEIVDIGVLPLGLLLESDFADEKLYLKAIENINLLTQDTIKIICTGKSTNRNVLEKYIDEIIPYSDLIKISFSSPFMDEELYNKIYNFYKNNPYYCKCANELLESEFCDYEKVADIIKFTGKKKNINSWKNATEDDLINLINEKIINPTDIDLKMLTSKIIDMYIDYKRTAIPIDEFSVEEVNNIINCPNLTSGNLYNLVDYVNKNLYSISYKDCFINIINSSKIDDRTLNLIAKELSNLLSRPQYIKSSSYIELCSEILKSNIASKETKFILVCPENDSRFRVNEKEFGSFLNSYQFNEKELSLLFDKYEDLNHLEKIIEYCNLHKNVVDKNSVFDTIVSGMFTMLGDDVILRILDEDIFESLLMKIVRYQCFNPSYTKTVLEKIIDHSNVTINVINMLEDELQKNVSFEARNISSSVKQIEEKLNNKRDELIKKLYKIEEEEDVTEILRMNCEDGLSTMLWGPSGVGKSSRVFEVDPTATMLILKNGMLPEEVIGGRDPNGKPGEIFEPHWLKVLKNKCSSEPDRNHILFIDEITNVNDTIKNLVWEIVGDRKVNGHEEFALPENCVIVLAGNRPEESSTVKLDSLGGVIPAPLQNRIDSMITIEFDLEEWSKWALEINPKTGLSNIHPIVFSFCAANYDKVMFSSYDPEKPDTPFLTPRRWEKLSNAIYKAEERGKNVHMSYARINSILGEGPITNAFIHHYERQPIDFDKLEHQGYKKEDFPRIDDQLYALGCVIANNNLDEMAVEEFIRTCLDEEKLAIYYSMKGQKKAIEEIKENTEEFVENYEVMR